jgi:calcium/calmodulin-dependent protein kinase I
MGGNQSSTKAPKAAKKGSDAPAASAAKAAPAPAPVAAAPAAPAVPDDTDDEYVVPGSIRTPVADHYDVLEDLGKGGFAIVRKAKSKKTGELVAIKFVDKKTVSGNPEDLQCLRREIAIMTQLSHPNVLRLYEVFETPAEVIMVMELVTGGELFYKIVERGSFSEADASNIVHQLVLGVGYMHDQKIAHRDLKPENLLCGGEDRNIQIKIADFGLSKAFTAGDPLKTACGTPDYAAPEVLASTGEYSDAVDLWAVGVITYVLLCGYPPFYANSIPELFEQIKNAQFDFPPEEWSTVSEHAKDFIRKLLVTDPKARLSAKQAAEHPWLHAADARSGGAINMQKMKDYATKRKQQGAL